MAVSEWSFFSRSEYLQFMKYSVRAIAAAFSVFCVFFIMVFSTSLRADTVKIAANFERFIVDPLIEVYEDKSGDITIDDLINDGDHGKFQSLTTKSANFGYTDSAYWLRFSLINESSKTKNLLLELSYPLLDSVSFYTTADSKIQEWELTGDEKPFSTREIAYQNLILKLNAEPNQKKFVYLRIKTETSNQVSLTLWDQLAFTEHVKSKQFGLGIYYGTMIVMVIYNLFLFAAVRDRIYLFYVSYIASFITVQLALNGIAAEYLWPGFPEIGNKVISFWVLVVNLTATLFWASFLDLKTNAPKLHKVAMVYVSIAFIGILANFVLSYSLVIRLSILLTMVNCLTAIGVGVYCWRKGVPTAIYYIIAWSIFLVGSIVKSLTVLGFLPTMFITDYAQQIGSSLEVILLSLGLADRINHLKRAARYEHERFLELQLVKNKEEIQARQKIIDAQNESARLKDGFMATISHEMRTPMNGVLGAIELLNKQEMEGDMKRHVQLAEISAENMINIVDRILNFTQIQSGMLELNVRNFSLYEILAYTCHSFESEIKEKGIKLRVDCDPLKDKVVTGDPDKVVSIVRLLMDNAIKFTDKGTVTCQALIQENNQIRLIIKDQGIGMDAAELDKIFEPFQQGNDSFNRPHGGLGIGLSTAKELVKALGADITVESQSGKGSRFIIDFTFPFKAIEPVINSNIGSPASEDSEYAEPVRNAKGENKPASSILIVEDNKINRVILEKMVKSLGFKTVSLENGKEALDYLSAKSVDLILMDCQMPVMDGFDATSNIRSRLDKNKTVPIIAVTANVTDQDKKRVFSSGMDELVAKPVKIDRIKKAISRWLGQRSNTARVNSA